MIYDLIEIVFSLLVNNSLLLSSHREFDYSKLCFPAKEIFDYESTLSIQIL